MTARADDDQRCALAKHFPLDRFRDAPGHHLDRVVVDFGFVGGRLLALGHDTLSQFHGGSFGTDVQDAQSGTKQAGQSGGVIQHSPCRWSKIYRAEDQGRGHTAQ